MTALTHQYTIAEEIANAISHGLGFILSIAALTLMLLVAIDNQDPWQLASAIIFGMSLVVLFLASTLYHSITNPAIKYKLKLLDHCAIYLLIAGTYTPFMLVSLKGVWGFSLLVLIWLLAISGIIFKLNFAHKYPRVSLWSYLIMGWLALIAMPEMINKVPSGALTLLTAGGVAYTLGAVFYVWRQLTFNHAIWHLFVLAGSSCHFFAVYLHLLER